MVRVADVELEIPGSNPGSDFFCACEFCFFLRMRLFLFFCAILTQASTHALNLRKFANPYNGRNIDAQSAHVVVLRRYCAQF